MQHIPVLIGAALLIAVPGFSEVIITAEDYAVDSDVVLESAVKEVKSVPRDTVDVVGDVIKYAKDETITAAKGVAAVIKSDPHAKAQRAGELAVENAWNSSDDVLFRSYTVSDKIGDLLLTGATDQGAPSIDVSSFFKTVQFPEKTSARYLPEFKNLFVRHTMDNLLTIESVLASYQHEQRNLMGHQVEIETKFVEVSQSTLNELGFSWHFSGTDGNGGGDLNVFDNLSLPAGQDLFASGLRTASQALSSGADAGVLAVSKAAGSLQWNLYISALEQADDSDVLSAPRVVTLDGNTAVIRVGEEQMIPQGFIANNQDTSPYVEHRDWELELMGVTLEVTPEIREEGLIDLELHPVVMEISGYDTYQVTPEDTSASAGTGEAVIGEVPALYGTLPYVRIREIETMVTVADGGTVGMGGLIYDKLETFRDKVPVLGSIPFLGRLFRSEGEKSIKRNLMIFVTATQVDVDGRRAADIALKK